MKPSLALAAFLVACTAQLNAQLLRDDFSTNGSLAGSNPDVGSSWATISGMSGQMQVVAGRAMVTSAGDEDVQSTFSAQSAITIFAGFTLNYSVPPSIVGTLALSFRSAEGYVGRIFLGQSTASTFRIGVDNNLDNPVYWPAPLNVSTDYRIVLGFTENGGSDRTTLWVNPASMADASVSEAPEAITAGVTGFSFRQGGTSGDFVFDNLYVGSDFATAATVPEPSALAAVLTGIAALGLRRRRK